jgi:hypothetical protein
LVQFKTLIDEFSPLEKATFGNNAKKEKKKKVTYKNKSASSII